MYNEWTSNSTGLYNGTLFHGDDVILNNGTVLDGGILSVSKLINNRPTQRLRKYTLFEN